MARSTASRSTTGRQDGSNAKARNAQNRRFRPMVLDEDMPWGRHSESMPHAHDGNGLSQELRFFWLYVRLGACVTSGQEDLSTRFARSGL
eukprot:3190338-Prorocentrum_lima.AAC.1